MSNERGESGRFVTTTTCMCGHYRREHADSTGACARCDDCSEFEVASGHQTGTSPQDTPQPLQSVTESAPQDACPSCGHPDPHTGGGIGVCLHPACGCDGPLSGSGIPLTPDNGEDVPSYDGDEIETAFETVRTALGTLLDNSLDFTGYVANEAHENSLEALAALATIHRTMEGLRAERDESVNRWARQFDEFAGDAYDRRQELLARIAELRTALREATSRAEQAEAEREIVNPRGRERGVSCGHDHETLLMLCRAAKDTADYRWVRMEDARKALLAIPAGNATTIEEWQNGVAAALAALATPTPEEGEAP